MWAYTSAWRRLDLLLDLSQDLLLTLVLVSLDPVIVQAHASHHAVLPSCFGVLLRRYPVVVHGPVYFNAQFGRWYEQIYAAVACCHLNFNILL